jgi:hypothetical protein
VHGDVGLVVTDDWRFALGFAVLSAIQEVHLSRSTAPTSTLSASLRSCSPSRDQRSTGAITRAGARAPASAADAIEPAAAGSGSVRRVNATEHAQLPPIAAIADVVEALRLLGVGVGVDETVPGVKVGLAYSAVGTADRNTLATEQHARANGAGRAEFAEQVGAVLDDAARRRGPADLVERIDWPATGMPS